MFQTESIQDNHFFFKPGNDIASIIKDFFFWISNRFDQFQPLRLLYKAASICENVRFRHKWKP
jgi:hypothetical protein